MINHKSWISEFRIANTNCVRPVPRSNMFGNLKNLRITNVKSSIKKKKKKLFKGQKKVH